MIIQISDKLAQALNTDTSSQILTDLLYREDTNLFQELPIEAFFPWKQRLLKQLPGAEDPSALKSALAVVSTAIPQSQGNSTPTNKTRNEITLAHAASQASTSNKFMYSATAKGDTKHGAASATKVI